MPIDRQAKLIFIHIPKTAGTSVESALSLHGDWKIEDRFRCFGQISSSSLLARNLSSNFLQHLRLHEIQGCWVMNSLTTKSLRSCGTHGLVFCLLIAGRILIFVPTFVGGAEPI